MAMTLDSSFQRIGRLTPLATVLALIESRVGAAMPRISPVAAALGYTLAQDAVTSERPPRPIALRDGFAVDAAAVADAGSYVPVALPPASRRIDVGEALPEGADAVLPFDAVALRGERAEAVAAVAAGEGVLPVGGDASPRTPLRRAGERLRAIDLAAIAASGIAELTVRAPRIRIAAAGAAKAAPIEAAVAMLGRFIGAAGGLVPTHPSALEAALADETADAVIAIGGTGSGRRDDAVKTLARLGRVEAHGIAVSPGNTAAFGFLADRPVLLVPGRLDAALAVWLLIGRQLVAKLAGGSAADAPALLPLKRKVASNIGLTELIPVRCSAGMAEPLGCGYLSFAALARSDGWIVVPADSEGFGAGTEVAVRSWPQI